jgi:hypothetical protein
MFVRSLLAGFVILSASVTFGQGPEGGSGQAAQSLAASSASTAGAPAVGTASSRTGMAVSAGNGTLPNEQGQLWREYDISPYTVRVTSTNRPEQAIVDWILRETGYEIWHSEPLAILSATPRVLRVYHTPEMQEVVANIVDRFVSSNAETHVFGLQVVTVNHPNWRAKSHRMMTPVQVQTPGVQAWLLEKENAAMLLADLRRRSDFREHSSPHLLVNNGQSTVVSGTRARNYIRDVVVRPDAWPGYEPASALVDEGFSLEFSPLLSLDGTMIDATIKCNIDQVEKMVPVVLDVPTAAAPRQRTQIEVPQMAHFRFHERFRWPADKILLVGMGMVPPPLPMEARSLVPGLPLPLTSAPSRADLLVFVESKGNSAANLAVPGARSATDASAYRGRY